MNARHARATLGLQRRGAPILLASWVRSKNAARRRSTNTNAARNCACTATRSAPGRSNSPGARGGEKGKRTVRGLSNAGSGARFALQRCGHASPRRLEWERSRSGRGRFGMRGELPAKPSAITGRLRGKPRPASRSRNVSSFPVPSRERRGGPPPARANGSSKTHWAFDCEPRFGYRWV